MKLLSVRRHRFGLLPVLLLIVGLVLLFPQRSEAYAGPGAGFAVLSSFWTIFVAFLYSFYALVTWPLRQLLRMFRRRKAYGKAQVKRVVIVGFDGMDPELANRFMSEGKLDQAAG
jgi:membrane-bound ClpP family serine protease